MNALEGWKSFYVIVGPAAGTLIGLQFVVITLIAARPIPGGDDRAGGAFATPSVVHFGIVLLLSAVAGAPWSGTVPVAALWGIAGLGGMAYSVVIARRMRVQTAYRPVREDWLFHVLVPLAAYGVLAASGFTVRSFSFTAPYFAGAAVLTLLFIAIHSSWDAVTYHVFHNATRRE